MLQDSLLAIGRALPDDRDRAQVEALLERVRISRAALDRVEEAVHDGAVVVRGARVMAAGVFLPVIGERRDPEHGRLLGARHRAALALSRLTDALVFFVVSEETGEVSLAVHGVLRAGLPLQATPHRAPAPAAAASQGVGGRWLRALLHPLSARANRRAASSSPSGRPTLPRRRQPMP